ncbi:MAG TPA: GNAT family N-acetyltransferase [Chloroflexota bacterium]|nr:GNAT family N-acetyltransferase [Chloroflexota bacterium]
MAGFATPNDHFEGPRACRDYELPRVLDLLNLVFRIEAGRPPTFGRDWAQVYRPSNLDNIRVLFHNHEPVSVVTTFPSATRTANAELRVEGITGVATHPDFRKRGLAGIALLDCQQRMLQNGTDIGLLSTGIVDWYRRFGWENGGLERTFTLDRNLARYLPPLTNAELRRGAEECLEDVRALHRREPFAVTRSAELTRILLCRPHLATYTAVRSGEVVAYAVVVNQQILESGGPTEEVAGLIGEIFRQLDDPSVSTSTRDRRKSPDGLTLRLKVATPPIDEGFGGWLQHLGVPAQFSYLGMIRVVNARQLLAKLAPRIVVERDEEAEICLRDGDTSLTLSRRDLVKLCFGPERVFQFASDLLPAPLYHYRLDRV